MVYEANFMSVWFNFRIYCVVAVELVLFPALETFMVLKTKTKLSFRQTRVTEITGPAPPEVYTRSSEAPQLSGAQRAPSGIK